MYDSIEPSAPGLAMAIAKLVGGIVRLRSVVIDDCAPIKRLVVGVVVEKLIGLSAGYLLEILVAISSLSSHILALT